MCLFIHTLLLFKEHLNIYLFIGLYIFWSLRRPTPGNNDKRINGILTADGKL